VAFVIALTISKGIGIQSMNNSEMEDAATGDLTVTF
jgi:hypothetical protein